jgi:hypothetical protein
MMVLLRVSAIVLSVSCTVLLTPVAVADEPPQILAFSKTQGFRHASIGNALAALDTLGEEHGFQVVRSEDAAVFSEGNLAGYAAVAFVMTTGNVLDASQQAAFEGYIRAGGGFVGIHSASDTEYNWPWYGGLVGAYFDRHPAQQNATFMEEDNTPWAICHSCWKMASKHGNAAPGWPGGDSRRYSQQVPIEFL